MDEALVSCRFLHIAALMLAFGIGAFQVALAPPPLARALDVRLRPAAKAASVIALAAGLAWLALTGAAMGDGWRDAVSPDVLRAVLWQTGFGHVWLWRIAFCAALAGAALFGGPARWRPILVLAAFLLGSLGLVGHAMTNAGALGHLQQAAYATHLLAAGFWAGSLLPLALCLEPGGPADLAPERTAALRRFSGLGHLAVAVVVATGAINTWLILGAPPVDFASPYQVLLFAKIMVVLVMIGLALANRYALVPRLRASPRALAILRLNVWGEFALGLVALGLVSIFAGLPPS